MLSLGQQRTIRSHNFVSCLLNISDKRTGPAPKGRPGSRRCFLPLSAYSSARWCTTKGGGQPAFPYFKLGFTSKPESRTGPHNPTKYSETISENPGISDIHTGLKQNPGTHNYTLFRDYPPGQSFRTGLSSRSTGGTRADEGVDEVDRLHSPSCNRSNRRSHHL